MARTGDRPRGACGEGGTTVGADLLSAGHSPHPFAWSQALPSSCAKLRAAHALGRRRRRLLYRRNRYAYRMARLINVRTRTPFLITRDPFPYDPWGFGLFSALLFPSLL